MTDSRVIPMHPHDVIRDRVRELECEARDFGDPRTVPFDPRKRPFSILRTIEDSMALIACCAFAWMVWWALS